MNSSQKLSSAHVRLAWAVAILLWLTAEFFLLWTKGLLDIHCLRSMPIYYLSMSIFMPLAFGLYIKNRIRMYRIDRDGISMSDDVSFYLALLVSVYYLVLPTVK